MQRKNYLLISSRGKNYRNGMAMIMAISVIVIVATILALSLSLTTLTAKKGTDLYLYEQSAILSHSAAEYAMLKMSQAAPCSIENLVYTYNDIYDINTTMHYVSFAGSQCEVNVFADLNRTYYDTTTFSASDGTVILDVTVSVTDPTVTTEPIRYFRRTIQKL